MTAALADRAVVVTWPGGAEVRLVILDWANPATVERECVRYPEIAAEIRRQVARLTAARNGAEHGR